MNESLRVIFFNLLFRLYVLRIVILSALVATVTSISIFLTYDTAYPIRWTALLVFIMIHHIPIACRLRFFPAILDLSLAIAETVATGFFSQKNLFIKPWVPEVIVYHVVSSWTLVSCLALLTIFRLASVVQSYGKVLLGPSDMFEGLWPYKEDRPTIATLLFGRTFWKEHFKGESKLVRFLRGFLGLSFVLLLIFYAMIHMVFQPIRETSLTPVQEYRTTILTADYKIDPMLWNIVIGPISILDVATQQDIINSISVIPLERPNEDPSTEYGCEIIAPPPEPFSGSFFTTQITYQCYGITSSSDGTLIQIVPDGLLITVNHTALPQVNYAVQTLNVVLGMSNQSIVGVEVLKAKSTSIPVMSGSNLVAAISLNIREIFVRPGIAAFGLYELSKSIWVATITNIYSDPSPDIIRDPAISNLRVYLQSPDPSELRILSDQRNNSVLAGFSALGGLWTSLCGLFAIIFGGSLLHYLYGSKVISILGAAHSFNHDRLREECLRRYPDIANEQDDHGLLALIRDYIINLDFLHNAPSIQPDVEKGSESLPDGEKKAQKKDNAVTSPESDIGEKHPDFANPQVPIATFNVNMPSTAPNAADNILRPVRRRPEGV